MDTVPSIRPPARARRRAVALPALTAASSAARTSLWRPAKFAASRAARRAARPTARPAARLVAVLALSLATLPACAGPRAAPHPPGEEARMSPKLYRVIQPVTDIDVGVRFYSALFGQPGQRVSGGRHYFDLGGTILAVYDPAADGDAPGDWRHHENQYLYFAVADLEGALARARKAGATIQEEIASMPWGERMFYALDPFGNPICLVDETTLFTGRRGR